MRIMLTSNNLGNQYLRPDYLAPMSNPLDAKNSPLALLAQTCSAIGTDTPNPKLLANATDKGSKSSKGDNREKTSPASNSSSLSNGSSYDPSQQKSSFKPYESSIQSRTVSPDDRPPSAYRTKTPKINNNNNSSSLSSTFQTTTTTTTNGRCESNQSSSSQHAPSPVSSMPITPTVPEKSTSPKRASSKESSSLPLNMSQDSPLYNSFKMSDTSKEASLSSSSSYSKTPTTSTPITSSASFFSGYTTPGLPYSMDLMTASALMSPHHQSMFKAASLNPYFNYPRMKVPGATDQLMSVCRDPYCTGCALGPHMMSKAAGSACPAGCTQCDHANSAKSYASQLSAAQGSVAAAYAHAQLVAFAAASQLPFLCNWISGDAAYCGKRFGTSDELLQHLRTHTSSMPESMLNPAVAALPPTHPLFQRTYPTPPLSPLSTARYHPYSKPTLLPPSLAAAAGAAPPPSSLVGLPMHHPSLAQYMSPYSFYGPRLGQSPSMHP